MQKLHARWGHLAIALIWAISSLLRAGVSPLQAAPHFQGGIETEMAQALAQIGIQGATVIFQDDTLTIRYFQPPVESAEEIAIVWARIFDLAAGKAPWAGHVLLEISFRAAPPATVRVAMADIQAYRSGLTTAEAFLASLDVQVQEAAAEEPSLPAEREVTQLTSLGPQFPSNLPEGYARFVREPVWSPQGNFVVFSSNYNTPISSYWASDGLFILDLYAVAVDGSGRMSRITETGDHLGLGFLSPAFLYPTGSELLVYEFIDFDEFMRIDLNQAPIRRAPPLDGNGSGLTQLLHGSGGQIASSNDGRLIAWEYHHPQDTSIREVRVASLADLRAQGTGDVGTVVFRMGTEGSVYGLSFSPDASKLAIGCQYQKEDPYDDIFIVDTDGTGAPRRLLGEDFMNCSNDYPDWSSDDRIAFTSTRDGTANLYAVNPDGSNAVQLTYKGGSDPSWSPDGSRLAFISSRSGSPEVWVIAAPPRPSPSIIKPVSEPQGPEPVPYPLPPTGPSWELALSDDFSNPHSGWPLDSVDPYSERTYQDGEYRIVSEIQRGFVMASFPAVYEDFALEVDVRQVEGPADGSYGLIFRSKDTDDWMAIDWCYYLVIDQEQGAYYLAKWQKGWTMLQELTPSPSVWMGKGTNHIRLECAGPEITVYLNGELVTQVKDADPLSGGRIGLLVGGGSTPPNQVHFDNLKVWTLGESAAMVPTPIPAPTQPPLGVPPPVPVPTQPPIGVPSPVLAPAKPPIGVPSPVPAVTSLDYGNKIAFSSNRDGNEEIYVMNTDGSGQTRLTDNPASDWGPDWSPDAGRIAFSSNRDGNDEIYVMNTDGSGLTNLTNSLAGDWAPAWSPDGRRIAFMSNRDGNHEIYVMNADGSGLTNLTNNPAGDWHPVWSPDGGRIAFMSDRDGNNEIYVMNADGSGLTNLTDNPAWDALPAWWPDGRRIAFTSDRDGNYEIYVMNADGSGLTNLTNNPADDQEACLVAAGAWSYAATPTPVLATPPQHGNKIAFSSNRDGNPEIYVMNADGSGLTRLTDNPASDWAPAWSPDGERIAFQSERDGNPEIYVMNADGSGPTRLTDNPAEDWWPAWPPDGGRIAFHSDRDGNGEIYVINADGSGLINLTNNPAHDLAPAWTPDGRRIAFHSDRDGNDEIYVMNADGSGLTNLTNNPASDFRPAWSPDGGRIAFISGRDGNLEIYVMNADGSGQTRLTNNPAEDVAPAWWPDGQRIAFTSERDGNNEIYVMNADGSGQTNLTNNPAYDGEACLVAAGAWSYTAIPTPVLATPPQHGNKIAFKSDRDGGETLYIMNPDGTDQRRLDDESLYRQEAEREWVSPDGRYSLTVMDNRGNWDIYLDDGQNPPAFITTNDADDYDPAWSPAGDRIAFVSSRMGGADIWLMDPTGRNEVQLTHGEGMNKHPTWSPDGNQIAFWSDRQDGRRQIWVMNADGSNLHNISNNAYNDWDPVWIKR